VAVTKLEYAQAILHSFAPEVKLEMDRGRYFFSWELTGGIKVRKQWQARGDSDYPTWYRHRPFGGTGCVALACLVKWMRGTRPLYLPWWKHVCGDMVRLSEKPELTLDLIQKAIAEHQTKEPSVIH
jgi:hypothetical protein